MPVATINPEKYERRDLKTAPPDGFVMVRPLPYGMKLSRRDKATKMQMRAQGAGRARTDEQVIELETLNEWAMAHDFAYCIGEHNLTDPKDQPLDFANPMTLKLLDPKIGSEIERYLTELNEDEEEESFEDFLKQHSTSSSDEKNTLPMDDSLTPTAKV